MVRINDEFQPDPENTKTYQKVERDVYRTIKTHSDPVNKAIYNNFS